MIKTRNNKAICLVMAFVFCLTFLAPAFVAPQAAGAASTYSVLKTQTITDIGDSAITSPKLAIKVDDMGALSKGDIVTFSLPSGVELHSSKVGTATSDDVMVTAPAKVTDGEDNAFYTTSGSFEAYAAGSKSFEIKVDKDGLSGEGLLYVNLQNLDVTDSIDGDINLTIDAPTSSGFTSGTATIGEYISSGQGTVSSVQSVESLGDDYATMDRFTIQESVIGAIKYGDVIKLKLPNGFEWKSKGTATGSWGFTSNGTFTTSTDSDRCLYITASGGTDGKDINANSQGRIYLDDAAIDVADDTVAKKGDVTVSVSNDSGDGVTDQDVVVATYSDYTVTAEAVSSKDVVAGVDATELGSFRIAESIAGSVLANRTITLTLPTGVKWNTNDKKDKDWPDNGSDNVLSITTEKGGLNFTSDDYTITDNNRTLKFTTGKLSTTKTSLLFKKLQATIAADYTGDINVVVAGTAGVSGTVKVATVVPPVTMSVASAKDIVIGSQAQKLDNITIKESQAEAIDDDGDIIIRLPEGATWYNKPTVTVTDGDLTIDSVSYDDRDVTIKTKSESSTASTIELSDLAVTTDRTLPEGDFTVKIVGSTTTESNGDDTSTALTDNSYTDEFDVPTITSVVAGKCVTPADATGTSGSIAGQFKINSNIYQVNGVSKVMDSTPYIKNSRTYVPVRYLGYALGMTDDQIVWDAATQKVTFTKDGTTVELTIGSTTYTVNGESKTMDVAPEIDSSSRTMLPARFVAEAFGATVGWDASTGTIVLSK